MKFTYEILVRSVPFAGVLPTPRHNLQKEVCGESILTYSYINRNLENPTETSFKSTLYTFLFDLFIVLVSKTLEQFDMKNFI